MKFHMRAYKNNILWQESSYTFRGVVQELELNSEQSRKVLALKVNGACVTFAFPESTWEVYRIPKNSEGRLHWNKAFDSYRIGENVII